MPGPSAPTHCQSPAAESTIDTMGGHPATASPLVRRYTLEEFWELEPPPGGGHYELIAGVLYVVPPPSFAHSVVVSRLNRILSRYADAHADGCTLFVPRAAVWTQADTYLEPDLFLLATGQLDEMDFGSADLVVEVLSPSTAVYDRTAKADTYAALGVRELWLVDVERRALEQRVLADGTWTTSTREEKNAVESERFPGLVVVSEGVFPATP